MVYLRIEEHRNTFLPYSEAASWNTPEADAVFFSEMLVPVLQTTLHFIRKD
jgi:hypothetical protein